jgi:hypothetical protein
MLLPTSDAYVEDRVMTSSPQAGNGGPSAPQQEPDAAIRASDADREAVVKVLHDAVTRGLLTLDECDERVAAAYAARFVRDLPELTADLPPAAAPAPVAPGWQALAVLAWLQLRTALAGISWRGVRSRPRLAIAVLVVLAVLSLGAATVGELVDGGHEQHQEHIDSR